MANASLFRPTYPTINGTYNAAEHAYVHTYGSYSVDGVGDELACILRTRIMIMDGGMGTMIQSYSLTEEDFRGAMNVIL